MKQVRYEVEQYDGMGYWVNIYSTTVREKAEQVFDSHRKCRIIKITREVVATK